MKNKITLLISLVLILISSISFSQEKNDSTSNKLFVEFNNVTPLKAEKKSFWLEYIVPQIASGISLVALVFGWFQVKKQIKATEKNILKEKNLERTMLLSDNVTKLLFEIEHSIGNDNGNIANGKHCNDTHCLLEKSIIILLDNSKETENNLIAAIQKFKDKSINDLEKKTTWISNIEQTASQVINNKLNN